ncbi:MAG: Spy/CpxP family protein refolding chaperone [bacterium]
MRRFTVGLLVFMLVIGVAVRVDARSHRGEENFEKMKRGRGKKMSSGMMSHGAKGPCLDLELNDSQEEKVMELRKNFRLEMVDLRAELRRNQIKLDDMFRSSAPDMAKVRSRIQKKNDIRSDIQFKRIELRKNIRELLTEKQREKLPPNFLRRGARYRHPGFGFNSPRRRHGSYRGRSNRRNFKHRDDYEDDEEADKERFGPRREK